MASRAVAQANRSPFDRRPGASADSFQGAKPLGAASKSIGSVTMHTLPWFLSRRTVTVPVRRHEPRHGREADADAFENQGHAGADLSNWGERARPVRRRDADSLIRVFDLEGPGALPASPDDDGHAANVGLAPQPMDRAAWRAVLL